MLQHMILSYTCHVVVLYTVVYQPCFVIIKHDIIEHDVILYYMVVVFYYVLLGHTVVYYIALYYIALYELLCIMFLIYSIT